MRVLALLIIVLAMIAVAGFWLARARATQALAERRRAERLQEELDVWVDAEREGLARRAKTTQPPPDADT